MSLKVVIVGDSRLARMSEFRTLTRPRPDFAHVESGHSDEVIANVTEQPLAACLQEPSLGLSQAGG